MGAALIRSRAEWRRRWRSLVALGVGLGLAGAVVLTALAGAERTSSAYDRLVDLTDRYDVQIQDDSDGSPLLPKLADLPGVVASDRINVTFQVLARNRARTIDELILVAGARDGFARRFDRPLLEAGRVPDPRRAGEILLNNIAAAALGARVGDRITVNPMTQEQFFASIFGGQPPDPKERAQLSFTVTGIGRLPDDVDAPDPAGVISSRVFATTDIGRFDTQAWVRLADGQDGVDEFVAAAEALPEHSEGDVTFTAASESDERVIDTIAIQRVGLLAFALTALLVAAVAGGQALVRQMTSTDDPILAGLGLSRAGRVAAQVLPFLGVALVAAAVAGIGTVLASPLLPVGFAGRVEPDPGIYVYPVLLGLGLLGLVAFMIGVAAVAAQLRTRHVGAGAEGNRPSRVATAAAAAGAGPSTVTGLRLALEPGRGRVRLPVRSTLAGAALGAAGVAAVLTFGASLDEVLTDPGLHGRPGGVGIPVGEEQDASDQVSDALLETPGVSMVTLADQRSVTIEDEELTAVAFRPLRGRFDYPYLEGRAPAGPDEVAVGPDALDRMEADVGDTVTAPGTDGKEVRLEVVGSPIVGVEDEYDRIAVLTESGLARLEHGEAGRNLYVRTDGPPEQVLRPLADTIEIDDPDPPVALTNLEEAQGIPTALAWFLAALAVAALAHALLVGLRRRRTDLAVLRVLGLEGRQVVGLVAVQATTVAVIGALVGIPVGVAGGRVVWSEFARGLNVVVQPEVPLAAVAALGVGMVLVANLIGLPRALVARRLRPSVVLRTE